MPQPGPVAQRGFFDFTGTCWCWWVCVAASIALITRRSLVQIQPPQPDSTDSQGLPARTAGSPSFIWERFGKEISFPFADPRLCGLSLCRGRRSRRANWACTCFRAFDCGCNLLEIRGLELERCSLNPAVHLCGRTRSHDGSGHARPRKCPRNCDRRYRRAVPPRDGP